MTFKFETDYTLKTQLTKPNTGEIFMPGDTLHIIGISEQLITFRNKETKNSITLTPKSAEKLIKEKE